MAGSLMWGQKVVMDCHEKPYKVSVERLQPAFTFGDILHDGSPDRSALPFHTSAPLSQDRNNVPLAGCTSSCISRPPDFYLAWFIFHCFLHHDCSLWIVLLLMLTFRRFHFFGLPCWVFVIVSVSAMFYHALFPVFHLRWFSFHRPGAPVRHLQCPFPVHIPHLLSNVKQFLLDTRSASLDRLPLHATASLT